MTRKQGSTLHTDRAIPLVVTVPTAASLSCIHLLQSIPLTAAAAELYHHPHPCPYRDLYLYLLCLTSAQLPNAHSIVSLLSITAISYLYIFSITFFSDNCLRDYIRSPVTFISFIATFMSCVMSCVARPFNAMQSNAMENIPHECKHMW
jgi:hypothetical protein